MAQVPYTKSALPYSEQVALLRHRGLAVNAPEAAERTLASVNYYRLSSYWYPFRQRDGQGTLLDVVQPGTTFEDVVALYEFDRQLRLHVMDALERVEVALRTAVTYRVGMTYGAFGHEDASNFHPQFRHEQWLARLRAETERSSDAFVAHYAARYQGFPSLPIWMTTELLSLGSLSSLYRGLRPADRRAVADPLGIHHKRLENWLHVLTYVRNVCAHHSRLWNRELAIRPDQMLQSEWQAPWLLRLDRVFAILLILSYLLQRLGNGAAWRTEVTALLAPMAAQPRWRTAMGMPAHWMQHPYWV